ncbi:unnamed protein product [Vitrella brassicaformis CCMP3155]|uniref:RING-type domain-containing protein n=1 Tax=Vitrella brassicaformis (strain CCMP3155) TaxID=1169540 RepID=A0A0G4G1Y8_VITBC|nr:unnamed protein product [Vitrella brassicaformis CCMP3155]|eukprot:CEM22061.1 unnamed protein product [Vitrella brassicaformis CCMP3155]
MRRRSRTSGGLDSSSQRIFPRRHPSTAASCSEAAAKDRKIACRRHQVQMGSAVCKCVVCHEDYLACGDRAPQVLRCGRSICGQCVGQLIDHHPHGRRAAICPKCRKETAETDVSPNHDMRELLAFLAPTGSLTWAAQWLGYTLVWMPLRVGISLLGHADTEEMYYVLCDMDNEKSRSALRVFACYQPRG